MEKEKVPVILAILGFLIQVSQIGLAHPKNSTLILPSLDASLEYLRDRDLTAADTHVHSTVPLVRKYSIEEFLWMGSGDGPTPADHDGGLAWEDNGPVGMGVADDVIRITKTMVLFKTVLTTIYPVEMTPTVVLSSLSPTPRLPNIPSVGVTSSFSLTYPYDSERLESVEPTHTTTHSNIESSRSPTEELISFSPMPNHEKTKPTQASQSETTLEPTDSSASSGVNSLEDRLFWVQTIIKANNSVIDAQPSFQGTMQKNLAIVYASAFKRYLMSSLGVLKIGQAESDEAFRRPKRTGSDSSNREDLDPDWIYSTQRLHLPASRMRSLAMTTMNVTVSIFNITQLEKLQQVSFNYIVCAEGNPVPAASAVQELHLVSKQEMEQEIGYEVVNKAEALIASPLKGSNNEAATSPWLIVSVISISFLAILVLIIAIIIWNWKFTSLSNAASMTAFERDHSQIEVGVVNPAFAGQQMSSSDPPHNVAAPASGCHHMGYSRRKDMEETQAQDRRYTMERNLQRKQQDALASELNTLLMNKGSLSLTPSSLKSGSSTSADRSEREDDLAEPASLPQTHKEKPKRRQTPRRSRRIGQPKRRSETTADLPRSSFSVDVDISGDSENIQSQNEETDVETRRTFEELKSQFPGRLKIPSLEEHLDEATGRGIDKISYGDLEVGQGAIARPISAKARKLLPSKALHDVVLAGSSDNTMLSTIPSEVQTSMGPDTLVQKRGISGKEVPETINENSDFVTDDETKSIDEQDRDWSESVEQIDLSAFKPCTKDAQVQTPKRMKPKPRRHKVKQLSSESLISTESEEILEVHHIDTFSEESNPMGRMRKRFHQFLDDAFNVIGKKEDDEDAGRSKSAKVSISHHVETRETSRPWTSHYPRQEPPHRLRPKSASFGPPKRAWGSHPERRCYSAKSDSSSYKGRVQSGKHLTIFERGDDSEPEESDLTSTIVIESPETRRKPNIGILLSSQSQAPQSSQSQHQPPLFPHYPIYPDIPILTHEERQEEKITVTKPTDQSATLILGISEELNQYGNFQASDQDNPSSSRC